MMRELIRQRQITLGLFVAMLLLYGAATEPSVAGWDSAELTLGVHTQGIVHATGYPLYLLLAGAFAWFVPGEPALGVNLFSALMGAFTVALVYRLARGYTTSDWSAVLAAVAFGVGYVMWGHATVAEVYTLHTALVAGFLLAYDRRALWTAYALAGLMAAHHLAGGLVAVVVLPALLWADRQPVKHLLGAALAGWGALVFYTYLGWRDLQSPAFDLLAGTFDRALWRPADILWMVRGGMFEDAMFAYGPLAWATEWGTFIVELALNTVGVGLLLGVVGVAALWRVRRVLAVVLLGVALLQAAFFTSYNVFDKWQMFHTVYLVWAVFVAVGSEALAARYGVRVVATVLVLAIGVQVALNWPRNRGLVAAETLANLERVPADTVLIGPWTTIRPAEYKQFIDNTRPDVTLIDYALLGLGRRENPSIPTLTALVAEQVLCSGRPVVVIAPLDEVRETFALEELRPTVFAVVGSPRPPAADCANGPDPRRYDR
jgi:hypothetical protein